MGANARPTATLLVSGIVLLASGCGGAGVGGSETHAVFGIVSGDVSDGVSVTLGGGSTARSVTAGGGLYSFPGLAKGRYTVTPSLDGYTFSPASLDISIDGVDSGGCDFVATA